MAPSIPVAIFFTLTVLTAALISSPAMASPVVKGAYYPSWVQDTFPPSAINTNFFTHIYYAFLIPDASTFLFHVNPNTQAPHLLNFTSTLRSSKPSLKTLYSVGGGGAGGALFSAMASTSSSRSAFIRSSIETARRFGFDGVDLDWEFPDTPTDMRNFGSLIREWRAAVAKDAAASGKPPLLLTAAVYYSADSFLSGAERAYPAAAIGESLDWINVMNYDYRGRWDTTATGAHAALFDPTGNLSSSFGLGRWIGAGVPASKVMMGLPLYGKTWRLRDAKVHGVGAPAVGVGPAGIEEGILTYAEVVKFNGVEKSKVVFDMATVSAYAVAGTSWVGYDDATAVTLKMWYAKRHGLGGYFFWALSYDYDWTISKRASLVWSR